MSTMTWKQAIFLGGAVLILAACAEPTAPRTAVPARPASSHPAANVKPVLSGATSDLDCRTGYSVQLGGVDTTFSLGACFR